MLSTRSAVAADEAWTPSKFIRISTVRPKEPAAATLALDEGMRAFNNGNIEQAIKLLRSAADQRVFLAQYYLARIYGTRGTRYTDKAAAYDLYERLTTENADSDPQMDFRASFVARSELELARYLQVGVAELSLKADPIAARDHLVRAAQIFGDADAQFELAKLDLASPDTERAGLDLMATVADRRGHPGALAYMSQLWLTGKFVGEARPGTAFAYATLAMENAPPQDRIWIEQNYQSVFCATAVGDREQGTELLPALRSYNEEPVQTPVDGSHAVEDVASGVTWRCRDGAVVASPNPVVVAGTADSGAAGQPKTGAAANPGYRPAAGSEDETDSGADGITPAGMNLEQLEAPALSLQGNE